MNPAASWRAAFIAETLHGELPLLLRELEDSVVPFGDFPIPFNEAPAHQIVRQRKMPAMLSELADVNRRIWALEKQAGVIRAEITEAQRLREQLLAKISTLEEIIPDSA